MKNAKFFLFLAAFMVAIAACGGTNPDDGQNPNPDDNDPDQNQTGCEPNCPVEIQTVTRGLAYSLPGAPGGEVYINDTPTGTRMTLDSSRTMIGMPVGTPSRITVEGTARNGNSIRLVMIEGVMSTLEDMGTDINVAQTGIYPNLGGDWGNLIRQTEGARVLEMFWGITSIFPNAKYQCQDTEVALGGLTWGLTCVKPNGALSHCAGPDMDSDSIPDAPTDSRCERVVVGTTIVDAQGIKGEEIYFQSWSVLDGVIDRSRMFEYRFGRLVPPW